MKLYRNAIILVVILGLLVGAYFVMKNKKAADDAKQAGTTETTTEKLIDVADDKAKDITIEGKDGKLVIAKKDKDWAVSEPSDIKADSSAVSSLASSILALSSEKTVEDKAADLSKYGLSSPAVTVTVQPKDGGSKVLALGNETPLKDGYYVKLKDSDKVYTIGTYDGEKLLSPKNEIKDKTVFSGKVEEVTGAGMDKDGKVVFNCVKSGTEWKLTAPVEGGVNTNNLGAVLQSAIGAKISKFVEENPSDLDKYGLKNPAYAVELSFGNAGKTKVLLGKLEKDSGDYYARFDGKNEVFTVGASAFNFVDKPLKEMIDPFAYLASINDVTKIVVEMDGKTTTSTLQTDEKDKDKDKFTVDGKDATMKDEKGDQPFRKYYQGLIGITLSEVEIGAKPTGKPEITFTYYLKKAPNVMKVDFIPKDDKSYYVMRNDKYANIVVDKQKFDSADGVRETYKKLMEAMNKK